MKKTLIALALFSTSAFAQYSQESVELAKSIPLADLHMHIEGFHATEEFFIEKMNANNIVYGGAVGNYKPRMVEEMKGRYIPAYGQLNFIRTFRQQGERGLQDVSNFREMFSTAEQLFEQGKIKGFGEIHTHNSHSGPPGLRREMRIKTPVVEKMYEMADRYNGFVQVHAEYNSNLLKDLEYVSTKYPNAVTILSHCLSTDSPDEVERAFSVGKNIVCEISAGGPYHGLIARRTSQGLIYNSRGPSKDWIKFINKYQDRIMIGTDPCCDFHRDYDTMVHEIRTMFLPYFEPSVIRKLSYENAVQWLKLDPKFLEKK